MSAVPTPIPASNADGNITQRVRARLSRLLSSGWVKSTLFKDTSNICLGQIIRLALQGVYFLCIARSLGPTQYGAFIAVTALTSIIAPYVGLGSGIVFLKNVRTGKREADLCWGNGLVSIFVTGLLTTAAVCLLSHFFWCTIPLILIAAIGISDLILNRIIDLASLGFAATGKMSKTAVQNTTMSLLRVIGILFMIAFFRPVMMRQWIWVYLITAIIGAAYAFQQGTSLWGAPRFSLAALWKDSREGTFFSISISAQTIYNDIDKTMLAQLSTFSATGVYAAAYRIIDASLTPVRSLLTAAYPEFFHVGTNGMRAAYSYAKHLIRKTVIFGLVDCVALVALAPLLPFILGHRYDSVTPALQLLALIPIMRCVHCFLADALSGANEQAVRMVIQVCVALLNIGLNLLILPRWSWVGAAWTSLISDLVLLISLYIAVQWKLPAGAVKGTIIRLTHSDSISAPPNCSCAASGVTPPASRAHRVLNDDQSASPYPIGSAS